MADFRSPFVPELPRFTGGAVGYLGYDAASWFEPVLGDLGDGADGADAGRLHAVRHGAGVRSRAAPHPDHRQRAHHRRRRSRVAVSVRLREDRVPRARARAQPVASRGREPARAARRSRRTYTRERFEEQVRDGEGAHRRRRHLPGRAVAAVRGRGRAPIRSPSTARCATSTRRPTCISSAWAACRSSARRRRCWCASKARASRRIRLPARGRAGATTKRTCGSPRS